MMEHGYSVNVVWSKEDGAYIAIVPELPGCMADGETQEIAVKNVLEIAKQWLVVATEEKRSIPEPMTKEDFEKANRLFHEDINKHIQEEVQQAVNAIVNQLVEQHAEHFNTVGF